MDEMGESSLSAVAERRYVVDVEAIQRQTRQPRKTGAKRSDKMLRRIKMMPLPDSTFFPSNALHGMDCRYLLVYRSVIIAWVIESISELAAESADII